MRNLRLILPFFIIGCKTPEVIFPESDEIVVVEGWITDELKQHWVKLSRTVSFQDTRSEVPIEDATVMIEEFDKSNSMLTQTLPLSYASDGNYMTDETIGETDKKYQLIVQLASGEHITSNQQPMAIVPTVDSLAIDFFVRRNTDTGLNEDIYYPIVGFSDPAEQTNYYRYRASKNGNALIEPHKLELLSDQFINGQQEFFDNLPSLEYSLGDMMNIELHSLSKEAFGFLKLLKLQTTSLGSSSGTSPATLKGNLTSSDDQLVLGFFGASSVSTASMIIE